MKRINLILLSIFCLGAFSFALFAQSKTASTAAPDPRVAKVLDEMKMKYKTIEDGDYEITYGVGKNRSQTARIISKTEKVYEMEVRAVMSLAVISDTPFSREIADRLLAQNMETISSWAVIKVDKKFALFNIKYIPAEADAKTIDAAISSVTSFADGMEEQLMKTDEY